MSSAETLQTLLRFLTQDAKLPLATAMSKVKPLQQASLDTPEILAQGTHAAALAAIFADDPKQAKQVLSAAKRRAKKRASSDSGASNPSPKRSKLHDRGAGSLFARAEHPLSGPELEASLALPCSDADEALLAQAVVVTNRAPLMLAFVLTLLRFASPRQPLSSRLSLAQGYVAVTSRARAAALGIESGTTAEEEGFGEGRPVVRILGKDVRVLRRWGYEWEDGEGSEESRGKGEGLDGEDQGNEGGLRSIEAGGVDGRTAGTGPQSSVTPHVAEDHDDHAEDPNRDADEPALWALDLEALKKTNQHDSIGPSKQPSTSTSSSRNTHPTGLPIHTPQSARAYLLKAFDGPSSAAAAPAARTRERERNLALLLRSLELLYTSWAEGAREAKDDVAAELQRRTWGWYVRVRPEVADGAAGWGGKGEVALKEILALRKGQMAG